MRILDSECRLGVQVILQVVCLCVLANIVLLGDGGQGQRRLDDYRSDYEPVRSLDYGGMRQPMRYRGLEDSLEQRRVSRDRMMRGHKRGAAHSRRNLEDYDFGIVNNRSSRIKRHPHIYIEQYKANQRPFGYLPYPTPPPAPPSVPESPPDYYRLLWVDKVDSSSEPTGLWHGNGIVIHYERMQEFMVTYRFKARNIIRDGIAKYLFMNVKELPKGEERVRFVAPPVNDFKNPVEQHHLTFEAPRLVFNFGNSEFQLFSHGSHEVKSLDIDNEPDLPKEDCWAHRYMPVYERGKPVNFIFKRTPVTVFQRLTIETIRYVQVGSTDEPFDYYHMGCPVTCGGKLAYLLYSDSNKFTGALRVRAVSVAFLISQLHKWVKDSPYKTIDQVPVFSAGREIRLRHG